MKKENTYSPIVIIVWLVLIMGGIALILTNQRSEKTNKDTKQEEQPSGKYYMERYIDDNPDATYVKNIHVFCYWSNMFGPWKAQLYQNKIKEEKANGDTVSACYDDQLQQYDYVHHYYKPFLNH